MTTDGSTFWPLSDSTSHSTVCLLRVTIFTAAFHSLYTVSTSRGTVFFWICVAMSTVIFYFLSMVSQYLTLYRLLVSYHYVRCSLLQALQCLSVPYTVPSIGCVPLGPLYVSTWHCNISLFCAIMGTAVFYSLSNVVEYLTMCCRLFLFHCVHCCKLHSANCLSVPHNVPFVFCVSLFPLLSSTFFPRSVSTSHCTVFWFCVTMSRVIFYTLTTVSQYLTLYLL